MRYLAKLYGEVGNYEQMMVCYLNGFSENKESKMLKEGETEIRENNSFEEAVEKLVKNIENI